MLLPSADTLRGAAAMATVVAKAVLNLILLLRWN